MIADLPNVIAQLKNEKAGIERAMAALQEVHCLRSGSFSPIVAIRAPHDHPLGPIPGPEMQEKPWVVKRPPGSPLKTLSDPPAPPGRNLTPGGRKRLADSMKRRWAVKKAKVVA